MGTIFRTMVINGLRDKYLIFWSVVLPLGLLLGLGLYFNTPQYQQRLLAGVTGTSVIFWAMVTTAFMILQQRNRGVYKLLKITPMPVAQFIMGMTSAWSIISLIVSAIVIIAGTVVFGISLHFTGILVLIGILVIATICFTFFSFIVANFSRNEGQTSMISNLFVMPMLFISDAFYSLENAPKIIKVLSYINPFNYFVTAVRNAIQYNLENTLVPALVLICFTILSLAVAVATFKWE